MRTQAAIIGIAFIIFGGLAWAFTSYSPAYIGLMGFGVAALLIGFSLSTK
jgi:hypothetical protein